MNVERNVTFSGRRNLDHVAGTIGGDNGQMRPTLSRSNGHSHKIADPVGAYSKTAAREQYANGIFHAHIVFQSDGSLRRDG